MQSRSLGWILLATVPLASIGLYLFLGNPLSILDPNGSTTRTVERTTHQASGGIAPLAERLKTKLEQDPSNGSGWALLARSYVELGRHGDAVPAFQKAVALINDDAQLLADYADALGVVHDRNLKGKPEELIRQALTLDPQNVKARMLAATAAFHRQEYTQAIAHWEATLTEESVLNTDLKQEIQANILEAQRFLKGDIPSFAIRPVTATKPESRTITGTVHLAPHLKKTGEAMKTLYIFARTPTGPPMPVAAFRASKPALPFAFQLDDSHSIMPTRKLSQVGDVVVVARLSQKGDAMPSTGDLEGTSQPTRIGTSHLEILIDTTLP